MYHMIQIGGDTVNEILIKQCRRVLLRTPAFSSLREDELDVLLHAEGVRLLEFGAKTGFEAGESLGVLIKGKADIYKDRAQKSFLKTLVPGEPFGVSALFGEAGSVSFLVARGSCTVLFLPEARVKRLIADNREFALSYAAFLTGRIRYLNAKIDCYTSADAVMKLRVYLSSLPQDQDGTVVLPLNMQTLSKTLNIGRASLYRAFGALTENGEIRKTNHTVKIIQLEGEEK